MYQQIVNPATGRKVNVGGKIGKQVLQQYREQMGGEPIGNPFSGLRKKLPSMKKSNPIHLYNPNPVPNLSANKGYIKKEDEKLPRKTDVFIRELIETIAAKLSRKFNFHNTIKLIIESTCADLTYLSNRVYYPRYFLVDRNFNVNKGCYQEFLSQGVSQHLSQKDKKTNKHHFQFWSKFTEKLSSNIIGKTISDTINTSLSDINFSSGEEYKKEYKKEYEKSINIIKIYVLTYFKIVLLTEEKQGVYGPNCNSSMLKGTRKTIMGGIKKAGTSLSSASKNIGTLIQSRDKKIEVWNAAKTRTIDAYNHSLGKSTYVKNLIEQIQALKTEAIEQEKIIKANKHNLSEEIKEEYKKIRKQEQTKLKELQDIDEKYVAVTKQGYLALPIKNSYCNIKTALIADKLTDICSCNRTIIDRRATDVDQQFIKRHIDAKPGNKHNLSALELQLELEQLEAEAKPDAPSQHQKSNTVGAERMGTVVSLVGGKRRNAKRTSKKRNASKKRRNTSKNNNRR